MKHIKANYKGNVPYTRRLPDGYTGTVYFYGNPSVSIWVLDGWIYKAYTVDDDWTRTLELKYYDYDKNVVKSFEEMFDSLPTELQEIIIWNLDIWRLETTKDLEVT